MERISVDFGLFDTSRPRLIRSRNISAASVQILSIRSTECDGRSDSTFNIIDIWSKAAVNVQKKLYPPPRKGDCTIFQLKINRIFSRDFDIDVRIYILNSS